MNAAASSARHFFQVPAFQPSALNNVYRIFPGNSAAGAAAAAANPQFARLIEAVRAEAARLSDAQGVPLVNAGLLAETGKLHALEGPLLPFLDETLQQKIAQRSLNLHREIQRRMLKDGGRMARALGQFSEENAPEGAYFREHLVHLGKSAPAETAAGKTIAVPEPQPAAAMKKLGWVDWFRIFRGKSSLKLKDIIWRQWAEFLTLLASLPFLALQLPQLLTNIHNMQLGTHDALDAIKILSWMGIGSTILADLMVLSWFLSDKEIGPARIQAVGIVTASMVLATIWLSGFLSPQSFALIVLPSLFGMVYAYRHFKGAVPAGRWNGWSNVLNAVGMIVVPLAVGGTFAVPLWMTLTAMGLLTGLVLALKAANRLPAWWPRFWKDRGAWTATFLFMVLPTAILWNIEQDPAHMNGVNLATVCFGTLGNLMTLGQATVSKNRIWTIGASWAIVVGGLGIPLIMLLHGGPSLKLSLILAAYAAIVPSAVAFFMRKNMKFHGETLSESLSFMWGGNK